ncbi:class IV adenylate cyclase [Candidatus Woesearchaeota archaeon]|nr:class IV adenylate cyclase [Candidatus Woesearchaeota archaeon]
MPTETEVKIKINNLDAVKAKVIEMRAELFKKRALQIDYAYDNKGRLRKNGECLRIRDNAILTYKGPKQKGSKMKIREEIEVMVDNGKYLEQILAKLGYFPTQRKEKYRESYIFHLTQICLDETPMGSFLEIEGSKDGVLDVAKRLGFTEKNFNNQSYGTLWEEYAEKHKIKGDMVFSK